MSSSIFKTVKIIALLVAGTAPAFSGDVRSITLSEPIAADGMALDASNNLYVASAWEGKTIAKIELSSGQVSTITSSLKGPIDVALDVQGNLFASNWQGTSITKIDNSGQETDWVQVGPKGDGLAFDSKGNLWFTVGGTNEIFKIAPNGTKELVHKGGILNYPLGIAINDRDEIFVGGGQTGEIYKFTEGTDPELFASVPGPGPWRIGHLKFAGDRLFASGLNSNKIFSISTNGTVSVLAGSGEAGHSDGDSASATFTFPVSLHPSADLKSLYVFSGMAKTDKLRIIDLEE